MNVESRTSARTSKLPPGHKLTNLCLYILCVSIFVLEQPIERCVDIRNLQKVVYCIVFSTSLWDCTMLRRLYT